MLLSMLAAVLLQAAPSLETPGIVLVLASDTAFMAPTASIGREGDVRRATLIEIYPLGTEDWEVVRRDTVMELDCLEPRLRFIEGAAFDVQNRERKREVAAGEWEPIPEGYPPLQLLHAATCSDLDLASASYPSLEAELPRLRGRLN